MKEARETRIDSETGSVPAGTSKQACPHVQTSIRISACRKSRAAVWWRPSCPAARHYLALSLYCVKTTPPRPGEDTIPICVSPLLASSQLARFAIG